MRVPAFVAAALAALVLGAGATGALAADRPTLADEIAARLGVSPEQLRAAFKAALVARVDAAVAAGKLTPEQGARLKERIAKANGLGLGARRAFAEKRKAFGDRLAKSAKRRGPAAEYLGMTREALARRAAQGPVARPDRAGARQERRRARRGDGRAREGAAREGGREQATDAAACRRAPRADHGPARAARPAHVRAARRLTSGGRDDLGKAEAHDGAAAVGA